MLSSLRGRRYLHQAFVILVIARAFSGCLDTIVLGLQVCCNKSASLHSPAAPLSLFPSRCRCNLRATAPDLVRVGVALSVPPMDRTLSCVILVFGKSSGRSPLLAMIPAAFHVTSFHAPLLPAPYPFSRSLCCGSSFLCSFASGPGWFFLPSHGILACASSNSGDSHIYILWSPMCMVLIGTTTPTATVALRGPSTPAYASSSKPLHGGKISTSIAVRVAATFC